MAEEKHDQVQLATNTHSLTDLPRLHHSILLGDPIAIFIGAQPFSGERWAESQHGFHYLYDLHTMLTFLPNTWLSSDGVNGAISGLVTPAAAAAAVQQPGGGGIQYMSSDWAANMHSNLERNVPVSPDWVLRLRPETEMIVFPMNINQSHWVAVLVTCVGGILRASLYNSLSSLGNKSHVVQNLPQIIDAIIAANPDATRWSEARWGRVKVSGVNTVQQVNLDDCGVFAIRNCVSLLQKQVPSLTLSEATAVLREQYPRAYVDGVNRAPQHVFRDVAVGQTTHQNETVTTTTNTPST